MYRTLKPDYYKFISTSYDTLDVMYFRRKSSSPRNALVEQIPSGRTAILDVCAGTCANSILIAKNRPEAKITALDLSPEMLKIAKKKFQKQGIKNIKTVIGDASHTGLPDKSFDVILLSLVLHEISEELRKAILGEIRRLLNDNGRLIVIEWEQPVSLFQRIIFTPIKQFEPKGFKQFLKRDLAAYFYNEGFCVTEKIKCDYTRVFILKKNERAV
jgi:demethylmenaquinone methyltransferase/2-methoxy-6-polyprenyl-1,4-benzoquinol methylase